MQISLKIEGLDTVRKLMDKLSGSQLTQAMAKGVNDAAYEVRRKMQAEMASVFDRPTPYILRSVQVKQATSENLAATIEPTYYGGKGIDPQQILRAQEAGGTRHDKRSEVALRRAGILPNGYQTSIPDKPLAGSDDGRGNLRGPFIVQLISYFQAFGEQGYRSNMTTKRKASLQKGNAKKAGVRYFVAYGKMRGGKTGHFAPGIWAVVGVTGADVRPVLMFVRKAQYKPRLSMEGIAQQADAENYLAKRLRYRIRQAAGV
jgi:hypothetical protein